MNTAVRKAAAAVTVVLALSAFLLGCASKSDSGATGGKPSEQPGSAAPSETAKKEAVTLRFTYWGSPYEKKAMENAIAKFEEKYGYIKIDAQHIPSDYVSTSRIADRSGAGG